MVVITCKECRQRLLPEDPRVPCGPYHQSSCDYYCDKPAYFRELENIKLEIKPIFRPRPVDDEIDQLKAGFLHLQKTLNELADKRKSDEKKTKYTIK